MDAYIFENVLECALVRAERQAGHEQLGLLQISGVLELALSRDTNVGGLVLVFGDKHGPTVDGCPVESKSVSSLLGLLEVHVAVAFALARPVSEQAHFFEAGLFLEHAPQFALVQVERQIRYEHSQVAELSRIAARRSWFTGRRCLVSFCSTNIESNRSDRLIRTRKISTSTWNILYCFLTAVACFSSAVFSAAAAGFVAAPDEMGKLGIRKPSLSFSFASSEADF